MRESIFARVIKRPFLVLSIFFSMFYWLIESIVHYFLFDDWGFEFIPVDSHELWMRFTVTSLIIIFGLVSDLFAIKIIKKENEKWEVYASMIQANNHILNNFLNKMYLFYLEAEESKDFDKDILSQYSIIINETKAKIKNLEGIDNPKKHKIEERLQQHL